MKCADVTEDSELMLAWLCPLHHIQRHMELGWGGGRKAAMEWKNKLGFCWNAPALLVAIAPHLPASRPCATISAMPIDLATLRRIINNAALRRESDGDECGRLALLALLDALDEEAEPEAKE